MTQTINEKNDLKCCNCIHCVLHFTRSTRIHRCMILDERVKLKTNPCENFLESHVSNPATESTYEYLLHEKNKILRQNERAKAKKQRTVLPTPKDLLRRVTRLADSQQWDNVEDYNIFIKATYQAELWGLKIDIQNQHIQDQAAKRHPETPRQLEDRLLAVPEIPAGGWQPTILTHNP